jgi:hypothetical protein
MDWTVLTGTVKGEDIVTAFDAGTGALPFFGGAAEAGVHDEEWPLDARFVDAMQVSRKRCVLIGDLYRQDGRIPKSAAGLVCVDGFLVCAVDARIGGIAVKEEL